MKVNFKAFLAKLNPASWLAKFKKKKTDDFDDFDDDDFDEADAPGAPSALIHHDDGSESPTLEGFDEPARLPPAANDMGEGGGASDAFDDDDNIDFSDDDEDNDPFAEKSGLDPKKKKLIAIASAASIAVLALGGGAYWYFGTSHDETEAAHPAKNDPTRVGLDLAPPSETQSGLTPPSGGGGGLKRLSVQTTAPGFEAKKEKETASDPDLIPAVNPNVGVQTPPVSTLVLADLGEMPTKEALPAATDPSLFDQTEAGILPKIAEDGRQPWQVYARPASKKRDGSPQVALVMTGLGMSATASQAALDYLPSDVTLSFNPYAPQLAKWVERARAKGHEVLIEIPMEPETFPAEDPGPLGLMVKKPLEENLNRLDTMLASAKGYIGVMTNLGSRFTKSQPNMQPLLEELKSRGLIYVDGMSTENSLGPAIANEISAARAFKTLSIDDDPAEATIRLSLQELNSIAKKKAFVMATASPYPSSIKAILEWTKSLESNGIALVPLSAIANRQFL